MTRLSATLKGDRTGPPGDRWRFWLLAGFLAAVFLLGGGSRSDILSLIILRPLSVAVLAIALWKVSAEEIRPFRVPLIMFALVFAVHLIQLLPLPPQIWTALPGRELASQAAEVAGVPQPWRPISLIPFRTWNSLFSLLVPLAALALLIRVSPAQRRAVVPVLLCIGLVDAFVSILQTLAGPDSLLYFYRITNEGAAVGLFSNRNHNAIFLALLLPLLALYARELPRTHDSQPERLPSPVDRRRHVSIRRFAALAFGLLIFPLIMVAGSRAGILLAVLASLCVPFILVWNEKFKDLRRQAKWNWRFAAIGASVVGLCVACILLARAPAVQRILNTDTENEYRLAVWSPILDMIGKYSPIGSGLGSFAEVYQVDEPAHLIQPLYLNHAHNDWLEVALTAGVPGILLLVAGVALWVIGSRRLVVFRRQDADTCYGICGSLILLLLAMASLGDYPARTPSLACLAMVAVAWMIGNGRVREPRDRAQGSDSTEQPLGKDHTSNDGA